MLIIIDQVTPSPEKLDVQNGYMLLDSEWLQENSHFRLSCPMQPQVVRPNPLTLQPVAYVRRGPIIYCVEDVDHPWEVNHFKVTQHSCMQR